MNTKVRNSNIELLRIIAMMFIVIWHISVHAQKGELPGHNYIAAITTTGVNLFVLISGYWGIKLKWKSLLNILSIVVFYYSVQLIADVLVFGSTPSVEHFINVIAPISRSPWWFMTCYIVLMLISPGLNIVKNNATDKQYKQIIAILAFLSCISGFIFTNGLINPNGFNLFHFITLYFVGDAIKRFKVAQYFKTYQLWVIYIISTIALFVYLKIISGNTKYNNPFLMIAAVSFFCIFTKTKLDNKKINNIARYMLPLYLLQESPFGFKIYKILYSKGVELNFTGWEYYQLLAIYIAALLTLAFILETIRRLSFNGLINKTSNRLKEKANIFDE